MLNQRFQFCRMSASSLILRCFPFRSAMLKIQYQVQCCSDTHDSWHHTDIDANTPQCDDSAHLSGARNTWARDREAGRHEKKMPNARHHSTCCKMSHPDKASTCASRRCRQDESDSGTCTVCHTCKWVDAHGWSHDNSPLGKALYACRTYHDHCKSCRVFTRLPLVFPSPEG